VREVGGGDVEEQDLGDPRGGRLKSWKERGSGVAVNLPSREALASLALR
jgi:hypothetical protein